MLRFKAFRVSGFGPDRMGDRCAAKWFMDLDAASDAVGRHGGIGRIDAAWVMLDSNFEIVHVEPD